ncbi:MAG: GTP cyclohydrolase I FolE [bacterium]|nr:GTP cyclohydrolase I FolE [bacterium]
MFTQTIKQNGRLKVTEAYEHLVREQLELLGHDPSVNGLAETPARVARFHQQHFQYHEDPIEVAAQHLKPFDAPKPSSLVCVRCSFSAFCEHHLLPFFGTARVVYLPDEKITGLSKISRVVNTLCSRPQIQERITSETAQVMMRLNPVGVLVDLDAEHTCMRVRGISDPCSSTRTRIVVGSFKDDADLRIQAVEMLA